MLSAYSDVLGRPGATRMSATGRPLLGVWSDGAPLEKSVERHLFEPFFSSESRSSGLGLYICRELCDRHAAAIGYERSQRGLHGAEIDWCTRGSASPN